jgi:hypothetical protein
MTASGGLLPFRSRSFTTGFLATFDVRGHDPLCPLYVRYETSPKRLEVRK